jgi:hypothetical protein
LSDKTKYFLDTEFIEDGRTIDLISIGLVCEDGRELYRQNSECNFKAANDWVWRNVFPHLQHFHLKGERSCSGLPAPGTLSNARQSRCGNDCPWRTRSEIRDELRLFLDPEKFGRPQIWGYYADYDWVAFCQLFGTMIKLPKGFPMYCLDLKQLCVASGDPALPKDPEAEHSALVDARWNKHVFDFLTPPPPPTVAAAP